MGKKLYVGNLSYDVTNEDLQRLFADHGKVESAEIISDRMTGRGKGFGFVDVPEDKAANAISAMNGRDVDGRAITVSEARPRAERSSGGRSGGGGGSRW